MAVVNEAKDPRLTAAIEMLHRTGSTQFQLRYSDDEKPTIWLAVGKWGQHYETAAGLGPLTATIRLAELVIDGGQCAHCRKPCGLWDRWQETPPLHTHLCWYVFDPELAKFRRSCEGET